MFPQYPASHARARFTRTIYAKHEIYLVVQTTPTSTEGSAAVFFTSYRWSQLPILSHGNNNGIMGEWQISFHEPTLFSRAHLDVWFNM
jgi:hypothetical protein